MGSNFPQRTSKSTGPPIKRKNPHSSAIHKLADIHEHRQSHHTFCFFHADVGRQNSMQADIFLLLGQRHPFVKLQPSTDVHMCVNPLAVMLHVRVNPLAMPFLGNFATFRCSLNVASISTCLAKALILADNVKLLPVTMEKACHVQMFEHFALNVQKQMSLRRNYTNGTEVPLETVFNRTLIHLTRHRMWRFSITPVNMIFCPQVCLSGRPSNKHRSADSSPYPGCSTPQASWHYCEKSCYDLERAFGASRLKSS